MRARGDMGDTKIVIGNSQNVLEYGLTLRVRSPGKPQRLSGQIIKVCGSNGQKSEQDGLVGSIFF